ncbi:ABC transporter permease [Halostella sp. JP-L12]|uniref:ABC transporter permease n=1 Tax=Halostella TaxID=1843185 RepID=UPI000EF7BE1D|nr:MULTISPECIES: ABC transporter permease subunit [Halostella]NHN49382.1 ABC transporter permease [Halostella sp. JP-L12]
MADAEHFATVLEREVTTLRRSRTIWLLAAAFFAIIVGIGAISETSGYVPLTLTLLMPVELLVPALTAAVGYRAVLADRERGETSVLQTYPLDAGSYVMGIYCGRLAWTLFVVAGSLLVAGATVSFASPPAAVLAEYSGLDSPVYYLRFVVLTTAFAAVFLALMVLLSTLARSARRGLVTALTLTVAVAIGLDLAILFGLTGGIIGESILPWYLALSPVSAYRGLVMTYVAAPVATTVVRPAAPLVSVLSLCLWAVTSLLAAAITAWTSSSHLAESA